MKSFEDDQAPWIWFFAARELSLSSFDGQSREDFRVLDLRALIPALLPSGPLLAVRAAYVRAQHGLFAILPHHCS